MRALPIAGVVAVLGVIQSACSSCHSEKHDAHDASPDTGADMDADSDTDSDADSDADTVSDAGTWEWTDLPASEDCGLGCEQLTFSTQVDFLEWDVEENLIVFQDGDGRIHITDIVERKDLMVPSPDPGCVLGGDSINCATGFPTISNGRVYYGLIGFSPLEGILVFVNHSEKYQQYLFTVINAGEEGFDPPANLDAYGNRIVSTGGCDNGVIHELCSFDLPGPSTSTVLTGSYYGGYNSIWGDVAVWFTLDYEGDTLDIEGYDFSTSEFFYITHDTEHQIYPKIQGNTVVYMDLKLGDSNLDGNWNHAAIFAYDIATHETMQITSGEWVAAYPDVYDNIIVWLDYRASSDPNNAMSFDGVEIWGYNMDTATEFQITSIPGRPKQTPRIWGEKVFVDMMTTTGGNAIYMFDLPDGAK